MKDLTIKEAKKILDQFKNAEKLEIIAAAYRAGYEAAQKERKQ